MLKKVLLVAVCFAVLSSEVRADFTHGMLARWTFKEKGDAGLKDDVSGLSLTKSGVGGNQTYVIENGSVSLKTGMMLKCSELNSNKYPGLKENVTIWARLRFDDQAPASNITFFVGLINSENPANEWNLQTLSLNHRKGKGIGIESWMKGAKYGIKSSNIQVKAQEFVEVAITYSGSRREIELLVDGKTVATRSGGFKELNDFKSLAIGRLFVHGYANMTFDEIRVYSKAVSGEWLGNIEAVK